MYGVLSNEASRAVLIAKDLHGSGDLSEDELNRIRNNSKQVDELFSVLHEKTAETFERFLKALNRYDRSNIWFLLNYKGMILQPVTYLTLYGLTVNVQFKQELCLYY